ncbi:MAG: PaaI family thioesterase [Myxococcota bacterium]|nr:PaaI family thioesterase [Myxococcota bacterium]
MSESDSLLEQIRLAREKYAEAPGTWPAKRELADAVRELMHNLAATDAPEEELLSIAEQVRESARRFAVQPVMDNPPGVAEMSLAAGMEVFRDRSPVVGMANPLAPPAELVVDHDAKTVTGDVFFGAAYEGAPGCVHGGFVAALFDEALGMATIFSGQPGMTGWIKVSYRSPTPLETPLRISARMDDFTGRKIMTSAELMAGDTLVAEATGLLITIPNEKFSQLRNAAAERKEKSKRPA